MGENDPDIMDNSALMNLKTRIVGSSRRLTLTQPDRERPVNKAAIVIRRGRIPGVVPKTYLPNHRQLAARRLASPERRKCPAPARRARNGGRAGPWLTAQASGDMTWPSK